MVLGRPGRKLWLALGIMVGLAIALAFGWRTIDADKPTTTDRTLCDVITGIIVESDASLDGLAYYRDHPDELKAAHEFNDRTLDQLSEICTPREPRSAAPACRLLCRPGDRALLNFRTGEFEPLPAVLVRNFELVDESR